MMPGERVTLQGLSREELNGLKGWVQKISGTRFEVRLDDGRELSLKRQNLLVGEPKPAGDEPTLDTPTGGRGERDRAVQGARGGGGLGAWFRHVPKRYYAVPTGWFVGLMLALFFSGIAPPPEVAKAYESRLASIEAGPLHQELAALQARAFYDHQQYSAVKGFFSCNEKCRALKALLDQSTARVAATQAKIDHAIRDAKAQVGVFSTYGVAEVRLLFWSYFGRGKDFAKRSTMWDMLFAGLDSMGRDEGALSFILRVLMQMLMNFTLGLTVAVMGFIWSVWGVIQTFQPGPIVALTFYAGTAIAAVAFLVSFLLGLCATTAGAAYVLAHALPAGRRIEEEGGERQRVNFNARRHRF